MYRMIAASAAVAVLLVSSSVMAGEYKKWEDVTSSRKPVKIYVEKVTNATDNPKISEERSTEVVKKMFENRISTKFDVVESKDAADIVFKAEISEYVWMEKAPITNIHSAGAIVMDLATRGSKNYARKFINYQISDAGTDNELLEGETMVTLKQAGMPEEKSYEMMYERGGKMLARDIFRKRKRSSLRPGE
ncbi:MAG: hypothetical protein WCV56_05505 [Candidatus Omnitrophota bacterium]